MKKIVSLYQRNYDGDRLVRDEVVPGAEWVLAGEGVATQKIDGTSVMVRDGKLFKRFELKKGKAAPAGFEEAQAPDPVTGDTPGWVAVGDEPDSRYHREAFAKQDVWEDGTYELLGPKIQGNLEKRDGHVLEPHGAIVLPEAPRDFPSLRAYLQTHDMEGIVWSHPNGRMVKLKTRDFGLKRGG